MSIVVPYLSNTHLFQEEARKFLKEGSYCPYPVDSYQYVEYWLEQNKRCLEGYKVGDLWIPGSYYFYLNFTQMDVRDKKTGRKKKAFPFFTDVDLEYFMIMEAARKQQKGVILVKPRRTGFSYKNAGIISYEYNFYRDSKCVIGAFDSRFSDNTMGMTLTNLNFLNAHTEWVKERNPDTRDHVLARFEERTPDGVRIWKGTLSDVRSLTFKDNPFASIGLSTNIFLFEEAGKFPNIIQSYNISEPCWKDGDDMIGIPILYGTGGDMEGGTLEFSEMFYEPEKYNLMAFDNIWDEDVPNGSTCGWFIPASKMRFGTYKDISKKYPDKNGIEMVDKDGNSIVELAKQSILDLRALKEQGSDQQAKRDAITQFPLCPKEAFLQSSSIYFPVTDLRKVLGEINNDQELSKHNVGHLNFNDNKLLFEDVQDGKPYREWPVKTFEDGMIEIFEMPRRENGAIIDKRRYIIGVDTYAKDEATTNSLGSAIVFDRLTRRIVAEYTGRPESTDKFYEICRKLAMFYDAKIMYEQATTNMFHYFEKKKSLHLLEDTPQQLRDRNTWREGADNSKGISPSKVINERGRQLIKTWLLETESEKSETLNLQKIRSVGLLKELISWEPDPKKNYDRISALGMTMLFDITLTEYQSEEIRKTHKNKKVSDYFKMFKSKQTFEDKWQQIE